MTDSRSTPEGRATILVVERDPHVRVLETLFLTEVGYAVEFADDGASALEKARQLRPGLLITEIMVPKLDGLALCRLLKEDPETKGIMVLIFSLLTASARARDAGADAFLRKPLAEQKLLDTVGQLLARQGEPSGREST
ncbi:MAG TPA: response regulator [Longimicrobiaceae bacterium]|nr:response regulator [Longimicrobiaceae bacterium]